MKRARTIIVPAIENARTGEVHRLRVTVPSRVWGVWRVTQRRPKRAGNSARVSCGADCRIKVRWARNAGDAQAVMILAVNYALGRIGGAGRAELKRCLRCS